MNAFHDLRARLVELAVDVGWVPPGWRTPPYPDGRRSLDRIGDCALEWIRSPAEGGR